MKVTAAFNFVILSVMQKGNKFITIHVVGFDRHD